MVGIREVTRNTPGALGSDSGKGLRSDIVILVMGASGVGKSYFTRTLLSALGSTRSAKVNQALATQSGFKFEPVVIHPLERYTIATRYPHIEGLGTRIVIVETPGFDQGEIARNCTDLDKLKGLASWLSETWFPKGKMSQVNLGGIIYLHDISLDRASGEVPKKYFSIINQLLGFDIPLASVILATTKWKNVKAEHGKEREAELALEHWDSLTSKQEGMDGAMMMRFDAGADEKVDALGILDRALRRADQLAGERFLAACRQTRSAIKGKTIRDPDFTRKLILGLKESTTRVSELLSKTGTDDTPQLFKESVEDLSRLMNQLTTLDTMYLFALEVFSMFKMIYNGSIAPFP